jgi:hypothetical protein
MIMICFLARGDFGRVSIFQNPELLALENSAMIPAWLGNDFFSSIERQRKPNV